MITLALNHMKLTIPDLPQEVGDQFKSESGGHPLYYVKKQPYATANYLNQVHDLLKVLPRGLNVTELCGGIGLIAASNFDSLEVSSWISIELDPSCQPIFKQIAPGAAFLQQDIYKINWEDFQSVNDLVFCDFPSNTVAKVYREPQRMKLFRDIAKAGPMYWEVTDVGPYWVHLKNHHPFYEDRFGITPSRDNYHTIMKEFMNNEFGYRLINHTIGGGAAYYLFERGE